MKLILAVMMTFSIISFINAQQLTFLDNVNFRPIFRKVRNLFFNFIHLQSDEKALDSNVSFQKKKFKPLIKNQ